MRKLSKMVLGLTVAAVACSTAGAVNLSLYDINRAGHAGINSHGVIATLSNGTGGTVRQFGGFIGALKAFEVETPEMWWYSFCTDFTATLRRGEYAYSSHPITSHNPTPDAGYRPWVQGGVQSAAAIYQAHVGGIDKAADSAAYGAALQLAIWEALYEPAGGGYDLNGGYFKADVKNPAVADYFNTFMASANGSYAGVNFLAPKVQGGSQGGLRAVAVPEPSMLLSSLLVLGLGWLGRRRVG